MPTGRASRGNLRAARSVRAAAHGVSVVPPIICLGGANLDRKLRTLGPLRLGTSNPAQLQESPGGVARNIAENLARLGLPVHLLTAVGADAAGAALLAPLRALGVAVDGGPQPDGVPTGSYTAVLGHDGELVLALAAMDLTERLDAAWLARTAARRAAARWLVADLNLPAETIRALRAEAVHRGQHLVVVAVSEPKMARLGDDLQGVDLLVLNRGELQALDGRPLDDGAALVHAWRGLRAAGLRRLVLSDGARGVLHSDGGGLRRCPALPVSPASIREVTGAGDAMTAGVVAALHGRPDDLAFACDLGLRLAALTLQTDATVSPALHPGLLAGCPDTVGRALAAPSSSGPAPP